MSAFLVSKLPYSRPQTSGGKKGQLLAVQDGSRNSEVEARRGMC